MNDDWNSILNDKDSIVKYFDNGNEIVVCQTKYDYIVFVSSISLNGNNFTVAMWRELISIVKSNESVIISSTATSLMEHLFRKYKLEYSEEHKVYYKGILWV